MLTYSKGQTFCDFYFTNQTEVDMIIEAQSARSHVHSQDKEDIHQGVLTHMASRDILKKWSPKESQLNTWLTYRIHYEIGHMQRRILLEAVDSWEPSHAKGAEDPSYDQTLFQMDLDKLCAKLPQNLQEFFKVYAKGVADGLTVKALAKRLDKSEQWTKYMTLQLKWALNLYKRR